MRRSLPGVRGLATLLGLAGALGLADVAGLAGVPAHAADVSDAEATMPRLAPPPGATPVTRRGPGSGGEAPGRVQDPERARDLASQVPPERYRVTLLTMDRGDEVWEMFGHNALLIEDAHTGEALAWNWGLFNFEDVDFIPRFLRGTMRYAMGPADPEPFLRSYALANRQVYAHRIHLTQAQAAELDAFVRWNFQPENRPYIYDYYRDNCSTRLRDALDEVLGGQLHARFAEVSTGRSYRWYSRRLVQVVGWVDQGLSFLLGMRGDRAISQWEAMFLPTELMAYLEEVEVEDPEGGMRPLLGPREVWVEATRPPLPAGPPGPSAALLLLGAVGLLLPGWLAGRAGGLVEPAEGLAPGRVPSAAGEGQGRGPRGEGGESAGSRSAGTPPLLPRMALALLVAGWGAFAGLLGLLLVAAWFTDHHFIQANLNLLYMSPLALPVALLLLPGLLTPRRAPRSLVEGARILSLLLLALALLGIVLQLTGLSRQGNLEVLVVGAGWGAGMALAAWRLARPGSTFRGFPKRPVPGPSMDRR